MHLTALLAALDPVLSDTEVVFCTFPGASLASVLHLEPIASFVEAEGLSLLIRKATAEQHGIAFAAVFRGITLRVLSGLEDVGLTAAVASRLAQHGTSANVIAAYSHDHVFVPARDAGRALRLLQALQAEAAASQRQA